MNENFLINIGLGYTAKIKGSSLVDQIDAILPQTQCTQCDFEGCRPYAEAIATVSYTHLTLPTTPYV